MTLIDMTDKIRKLEEENHTLAEAVADISRGLDARRSIAKRRLNVITDQNGEIANLKDAIKVKNELNDARREAHARVVVQRNTARNQLAADGAEINEMRDRIAKLLAEVKGAHSDADMWLGQVHQRDKVINDKNARIKQGDEELRLLMCDVYPDGRARGRLSGTFAHGAGGVPQYGAGHPPGQYRGGGAGGIVDRVLGVADEDLEKGDIVQHIPGEPDKFALSAMGYYKTRTIALQKEKVDWQRREKIQCETIKEKREINASLISRLEDTEQRCLRMQSREQELMGRLAVNPWTKSKVEGLQHKNQEIGTKLGYYKSQTYKLRGEIGGLRDAINVSEGIIKDFQHEQHEASVYADELLDEKNIWKRKYHSTLPGMPRFTSRSVKYTGVDCGAEPVDFADPTVGRNG